MGGQGGDGGPAGAGGQGGGGAGGTVKLVGSIVFTDRMNLNAGGGAGASPGQDGRFILGRHNQTDEFGVNGSFQDPEMGSGPMGKTI